MEQLRNPDARRLWHWGRLGIKLPNGKDVCPLDMDGAMERKHNILLIETKRPGETFALGQLIFLKAQPYLGNTVFIVTGNPPDTVMGWEEWHSTGAKRNVTGDKYELGQRINEWLEWADQHPRPTYFRQLKDHHRP